MIVSTANPARRRGLTTVAVLVCLIIITMISGAVIRVGSGPPDEVRPRSEASRPSGSPRRESSAALARARRRSAYTGESWEIAARDLDSADTALVTITAGASVRRAEASYRPRPGRLSPRSAPPGAHTKVPEQSFPVSRLLTTNTVRGSIESRAKNEEL